MKHIEKEEIKKLIKHGFDLELISFELDIPIEEIKQCELELKMLEKSNLAKTYSAQKTTNGKNKQTGSKMQQIRERYKKLYFTSNEIEVKQPKELPREKVEQINLIVAEIEEVARYIKQSPKSEIRKEVKAILTKVKQIEDEQLTVEQAEKLYFITHAEELKKLNSNKTEKNDFYMNKSRKIIVKKLVEAIDVAQSQSDKLEELKMLKKKITMEMQKNNPIVVGAVKSRIENKISKITQQKAIDRVRNDISEDIGALVRDLANGTLDIQIANEIIDKEAKRRIVNKPKNRFSITEEQEKRQILIQIKTVLMEKAEQYHIENPEKTIMQIQKLCDGELEQVIRTVIKNLTNTKDFERAKEVCDKFSSKDKEKSFLMYIRKLRKQIRNDEISDFVLKAINMNATEKEEMAYFELIENGLKMGNVNLSAVSLGKSQDGLRNITLNDIWLDEAQNKKTR